MISFSSLWERLPLVKKKKLLSEAGYSENFANSPYSALPWPINADVEYTYFLKNRGLL